MSDTSNPKYPELLQDLQDKLVAVYQGKYRILEDQARRMAMEVTELIRTDWGGQNLYICKGQEFVLSQRDYDIERQFDGTNLYFLMKKHDLTKQRIYQIVSAVREERFKKNQLPLFGEAV